MNEFLSNRQLKDVGARYVFCLMKDVVCLGEIRNQMGRIPSHIIPKYTVGWTDMEIKDAPEAAVIPFCVLSGFEILRTNVQLVDLKLLEKL